MIVRSPGAIEVVGVWQRAAAGDPPSTTPPPTTLQGTPDADDHDSTADPSATGGGDATTTRSSTGPAPTPAVQAAPPPTPAPAATAPAPTTDTAPPRSPAAEPHGLSAAATASRRGSAHARPASGAARGAGAAASLERVDPCVQARNRWRAAAAVADVTRRRSCRDACRERAIAAVRRRRPSRPSSASWSGPSSRSNPRVRERAPSRPLATVTVVVGLDEDVDLVVPLVALLIGDGEGRGVLAHLVVGVRGILLGALLTVTEVPGVGPRTALFLFHGRGELHLQTAALPRRARPPRSRRARTRPRLSFDGAAVVPVAPVAAFGAAVVVVVAFVASPPPPHATSASGAMAKQAVQTTRRILPSPMAGVAT